MATETMTDAGALWGDIKSHPAKYVLILCLAGIALIFGAQYLKAREAGIQAAAQAKIDAATAKANDAKVATLQQQIDTRDAAEAKVQRASQAQAAAITTVQAANVVLSKQLTALLPTGATGSTGAVALQSVATVQAGSATPVDLPNAPRGTTLTVLTPDQDEALAKASIACKADVSALDTCAKDKADLTASLAAEKQTSAAWKQSSDAYEKAVKGTVWTRFTRALKSSVCAGLGAAGGSLADKNHSGEGAVIGAVASVAVCSLFGK